MLVILLLVVDQSHDQGSTQADWQGVRLLCMNTVLSRAGIEGTELTKQHAVQGHPGSESFSGEHILPIRAVFGVHLSCECYADSESSRQVWCRPPRNVGPKDHCQIACGCSDGTDRAQNRSKTFNVR